MAAPDSAERTLDGIHVAWTVELCGWIETGPPASPGEVPRDSGDAKQPGVGARCTRRCSTRVHAAVPLIRKELKEGAQARRKTDVFRTAPGHLRMECDFRDRFEHGSRRRTGGCRSVSQCDLLYETERDTGRPLGQWLPGRGTDLLLYQAQYEQSMADPTKRYRSRLRAVRGCYL